MAKVSAIQKNKQRQQKSNAAFTKRSALKSKIYDKNLGLEERFVLVMKLARMSRDAAPNRVRNRCEITGRPRGCFRKFGLSRNILRQYAGYGLIPGLIKASW